MENSYKIVKVYHLVLVMMACRICTLSQRISCLKISPENVTVAK